MCVPPPLALRPTAGLGARWEVLESDFWRMAPR